MKLLWLIFERFARSPFDHSTSMYTRHEKTGVSYKKSIKNEYNEQKLDKVLYDQT